MPAAHLLDPVRTPSDRNGAEFVRSRFGLTRRAAREVSPAHLSVRVLGVADVGSNVDVEAGEIRVGVEEVDEVFAADHSEARRLFADAGEGIGAHIVEGRELLAGSGERGWFVGSRERVIRAEVDPAYPRAADHLAPPVDPAKALHQRVPRGKLSPQRGCRDVHACLDRLRRDHHAGPALDEAPHVMFPVAGTEA